ncbi:unnamed protein product [Scytosiphon promiscuus]
MPEQPPPLIDSSDSSSDESDGDSWRDDDDEELLTISGRSSFVPGPTRTSADGSTPSPGLSSSSTTARQHEAAEYCFSRMKQTQSGLETWDHADLVRSTDQVLSTLSEVNLHVLAVLQEAQVDSFTAGQHETSPLEGWVFRGRKWSGVVKTVKDLGMLQHLRDSRLIPYRLGCNCLYKHPGLARLLVGRQHSNSSDAFPRLMHINPLMSGPVALKRAKNGLAPGAIAFAGAEFVVVGKVLVGVEEVWEVIAELAVHFPNPEKEANKSTTPEILGLSERHAIWGTKGSTLFVSATSEGLPTLVEGQAPNDIDRFKAWHMEPQYHAISHHVWWLEDFRMFLFFHRLLFAVWFVPHSVIFFSGFKRFMVIMVYILAYMLRLTGHEEWLFLYYRSGIGKLVMTFISVFFVVWQTLFDSLEMLNSLARTLLAHAFSLPGLLLPELATIIGLAVTEFVSELARFVLGAVLLSYEAVVEATIALAPPLPGLKGSLRCADAAFGYTCSFVFFLFATLLSHLYWWYHNEEETPPRVETEARYRALFGKIDPKSKKDYAELVRKLVLDLCRENDEALVQRMHALAKGAHECLGERRAHAHACSAALSIAALKLKRVVSDREMAAINTILVKSGIIRDSLVRTARVMLATEPANAIAEVAHELMHAAHDGLIWPDEPLIALALQEEGRNPTSGNVAWHRAKWVAVAADMIVQRESQRRNSWFKPFPESEAYEDVDFRQSDIHPGERCVQCYSQLVGESLSERAAHMKMAGRKPSRQLSACKSATVRGAGKKKLKRHYEVEDDDCRVPHDSSRSMRGRSVPFPFFHAEARRPKVGPERSRRLALRLKSIEEKAEELIRLDEDMAAAKAEAKAEANAESKATPEPHDDPAPDARGEKERKAAQDRKAVVERKARRAKARKERAMEAEAIRQQRLQELEAVIAAEEKEVVDEGDGSSSSSESENDDNLCIVCMTEKRNACLVHGKTAHTIVCLPCGNRLKKANMGCPVCKRRIDVVIQNFTS